MRQAIRPRAEQQSMPAAFTANRAIGTVEIGVRSIDGVERLYYLKTKRKVLLVEPATRTVVGEIGG